MVAVAHIENHELDLFVRDHLDSERTSTIRSHVQTCYACEEKLLAGLLARLADLNQKQPGGTSAEHRLEERFRSGERGFLQTLCPLSFEQSTVQIFDVSKSGFGLLTK